MFSTGRWSFHRLRRGRAPLFPLRLFLPAFHPFVPRFVRPVRVQGTSFLPRFTPAICRRDPERARRKERDLPFARDQEKP